MNESPDKVVKKIRTVSASDVTEIDRRGLKVIRLKFHKRGLQGVGMVEVVKTGGGYQIHMHGTTGRNYSVRYAPDRAANCAKDLRLSIVQHTEGFCAVAVRDLGNTVKYLNALLHDTTEGGLGMVSSEFPGIVEREMGGPAADRSAGV